MMSSTAIINRRVNPLLYNLPSWVVGFRPEQVKAIGQILRGFEDADVVVLDGPTGSGKTLVGETVRLMGRWEGLYVCSSLGLQDQFVRDFGYAKVVKGRRNYKTAGFPQRYPYLSCDDCQWTRDDPKCAWCASKRACPYEIAKMEAIGSRLAVLNSAYALTEWNGPGRFSGRDFVVVDEADTFEAAVMNHVSVAVSGRKMAQYGWVAPKFTVRASWEDWLDEHLPKVEKMRDGETVEKEQRQLERMAEQMAVVRRHLGDGMPYAYTGDSRRVEWKPAFVGDYCKEYVWRHGKKWLLMSASVISSSSMLRGLGYDRRYTTVVMPSTFPKKNRPVIVRPAANMKRGGGDGEVARLAAAVRELVVGEPGRCVVHTVSYSLTETVRECLVGCGKPVFSYRMAGDRAAAVSNYIREEGGVLVAPSADRGVDLPDELCRLCVIAKVPYPNLGDRMVQMRTYGMGREGQEWYKTTTVRSIVQMAGRGVRHKDDWCRTVILDSQFESGVWLRGRMLFPQWFREAIVWEK